LLLFKAPLLHVGGLRQKFSHLYIYIAIHNLLNMH